MSQQGKRKTKFSGHLIITKNWKFSCVLCAQCQFLCTVQFSKIPSSKPGCAPTSPAAHLCSTARIRQDIRPASFCSCKLLWRSDECVSLPLFNTQPKFRSYELRCRSIEFIFLRYPNLERW